MIIHENVLKAASRLAGEMGFRHLLVLENNGNRYSFVPSSSLRPGRMHVFSLDPIDAEAPYRDIVCGPNRIIVSADLSGYGSFGITLHLDNSRHGFGICIKDHEIECAETVDHRSSLGRRELNTALRLIMEDA